MRVIVTRARGDAERTAAALRACGHAALLSPVLEIVSAGAVIDPRPAEAVIATSAHAFEFIAPLEAERLARLPLFVVGARTAQAAIGAGLAPPRLVAPSAADLSSRLARDVSPPARLLYLAGHDRKPDLEEALRRRGFTLDVVVTYAARALDALSPEVVAALAEGEADAVLHFSRRSAQLFLACAARAGVARQAAGLRHVCISQDAAADLGSSAVLAPTPDSVGLFKALEQM
jgi:uroporphyrinogen-III synthase